MILYHKRCAVLTALVLALVFAAPGRAQELSGAPGAVPAGGTTWRSLAAVAGDAVNVKSFGALGNNIADDTAAVQAAYTYACAHAPAQVQFPAGDYKLSGMITINCNGVSTVGAGSNSTVIYPSNVGDTFYCSPAAGSYVLGCNFSGLRIYRSDNETSGAAIHWNGAEQSVIHEVVVDGAFHDFQSDGSLSDDVSDTLFTGSNTAAGASIALLDKSSTENNSGLRFANVDFSDAGSTYGDGIVINNCDGCQFVNGHIDAAGPGVYLHPVNANDDVDNIFFTNWDIDGGTYGVLCDTQPGSYTGNLSEIVYRGQMYNQTDDGFHNDCAAMTDVHLDGATFLTTGGSSVALSAGSFFALQNVMFRGANNGNTGAPQVVLSGTAAEVNLDGAKFFQGTSAYKVPYILDITGGAAEIQAMDVSFRGAATGDVEYPSWIGGSVHIKPLYTDTALTVGSCSGIGTGTCSLSGASKTNDSATGVVSLVPAGTPGSSGSITLTMPFTAPGTWSCVATPKNASLSWATGATSAVGGGTTTIYVIDWSNNGTALATTGSYSIAYKCDAD